MQQTPGSWIPAAALMMSALAGCTDAPAAPFTGLSEEQRTAGTLFASQYEPLVFEPTLPADCLRRINDSGCALLVPHEWVQVTPAHFELLPKDESASFRTIIKVIDHPSDGGSLEATLSRFTWTANTMVENYKEQNRWRATIDEHPAVVIQYSHTDDKVSPGKTAVTKAYFTVKHDRFDRTRMRTFIISCSAPQESFDQLAPLFDEVASRANLFGDGT